MKMSGLLNLNKPAGITSRDAVNRVQRLARPAKVGHAGTLDPLASGVLVVAVGAATRLIEFVQQLPKHYRATFLLGQTSSTEDVEGDVQMLTSPPIPVRGELEAAARRLTGEILQRPPAFSAIKVGGRRAYKLARGGQPPELPPRPVAIHRFEITRYDYPEFEAEIVCSSGTYVRSLGRDLAESLGTGGVMSALVRTAVGNFTLAGAVEPDALNGDALALNLLPLERAVEHLPRVELTSAEAQAVRHGRPIPVERPPQDAHLAAYDTSGELLAILVPQGNLLAPLRVISGA